MNLPAASDITKEELWLIAFNLAIEVDQRRAENAELRAQLAQAQEIYSTRVETEGLG